ncbi:MAG: glycine oxidase ThiO [Aquificota bacterium]|nr:glycine oxidase ThiO [Aquificota bacterium]
MNILIVGSGVVGLSTALDLALSGERVTVVTRNYEEGASWVAGGMLAPLSEELEGDLLDLSVDSLNLYGDFIGRVEEVSGIKVFFEREGILRLGVEEEELGEVYRRAERYREMGFKVEKLGPSEIRAEEPYLSEKIEGGVLYGDEGNVDAEKLMDALLIAMNQLGVRIVVDDVVEVEKRDRRVESVKGLKDVYRADFYVFATGSWSRATLNLPVFPVKGQILKVKGPEPRKVCYSRISYIIPKEGYVLLGATSEDAGFDTRNTLEGVGSLIDGAVKVMPSLKEAELLDIKVGFRPGTPDGKPIFDAGDNYLVLVGHYRNGILWAPVSSRIALDLIQKGVRSRYLDSFSPSRFEG